MRRFRRPGQRREAGEAAVFVALVLVVLVGAAAFAIDLGMARARKQDAQAAADAAALAGAHELAATDQTNATLEAEDYATANGIVWSDVTVNIPPATGERSADPDCVEVLTVAEWVGLFSGAIGIESLHPTGRAVACASSGANVPALFAISPTCSDKTLVINGSDNTVIGGIHSNDDIDIPGSDNTLMPGEVTHTGSFSSGGSNNDTEAGSPHSLGIQPGPVLFDINDYKPGGTRATLAGADYYHAGNDKMDSGWLESNAGYNSSTGTLQPGLYYTTGDIDLSDSDLHVAGGGGVTFVSMNGTISLGGSNHDLTPWDPDQLLLFSNYMKSTPVSNNDNCDSSAIQASGSDTSWSGIMYAPNGQAKLNGSGNVTLNGAVVALTIEASGSGLSIDSSGLGAAGGDPHLVE